MAKTDQLSPSSPDSNFVRAHTSCSPPQDLAAGKWATRKGHFPLSHLILTWHQTLLVASPPPPPRQVASDAHRMALQPIKGLGNHGCGSKDTEPHKTAPRPRTPEWSQTAAPAAETSAGCAVRHPVNSGDRSVPQPCPVMTQGHRTERPSSATWQEGFSY